jgi:hypothetical protein
MHRLGIEEGSRVWLADDLEPHVANVTKVANQFLQNALVSHLQEVPCFTSSQFIVNIRDKHPSCKGAQSPVKGRRSSNALLMTSYCPACAESPVS